eukprot:TRINITY_DN882_c0_g1_i1.p1 TRINITY_DN882_c0_g1~~TRINITY_DN882_c0_g1_i1.p1  ORF type:complete len:521 (-),score=69.60 TRINITY_DN882_c0_g1_i1:129-1691(-)
MEKLSFNHDGGENKDLKRDKCTRCTHQSGHKKEYPSSHSNEENWKKIKYGQTFVVKRSMQLTQPVEFNFCTEERSKQRKRRCAQCDCGESSEFTELKRFCEDYWTKTPPRFKKKVVGSQQRGEMHPPLKPTQSKAPNLRTSARSRPPVKSSEEMDLERIANAKPFKARELDPRIFDNKYWGMIGLKFHAVAPPTKPEPFTLETERRGSKKHQQAIPESENESLNPFQNCRQSSKEKVVSKTLVRSSKQRQENQSEMSVSNEVSVSNEKQDAQTSSYQGQISQQVHVGQENDNHGNLLQSPTKSEPVASLYGSFREVTKHLGAMSEPQPSRFPTDLQNSQPFQIPTINSQPQPLQFATDTRRENCKEADQKSANEPFQFRSRPLPMTTFEPHQFKPASRRKITSLNITLHSDRRAKQRAQFEQHLQQSKQTQELNRNFEECQALKRQQEEIQQYRKQLEFKAQLMPDMSEPDFYPDFSDVKLPTVAITPKLGQQAKNCQDEALEDIIDADLQFQSWNILEE